MKIDGTIDWKAVERRMKEFRKGFNERVKRTCKLMEKARREKSAVDL